MDPSPMYPSPLSYPSPLGTVAVPPRFDDAAAQRLGSALGDLADELRSFRLAAQVHAELAGQDWAGYSRRWFDQEMHELLTAGRTASFRASDDQLSVTVARAWAVAELQRRTDEANALAAALAATAAAGS